MMKKPIVAPRVKGRPRTKEAYQKVTVCLYDRQTLWLDKVALAIREKIGKKVTRAELIRALVDHAKITVLHEGPANEFEKAVRNLLCDI